MMREGDEEAAAGGRLGKALTGTNNHEGTDQAGKNHGREGKKGTSDRRPITTDFVGCGGGA